MNNVKKAHKHAEVIKAWADGAQIQIRNYGTGEWTDWDSPTWSDGDDYRIKPPQEFPKSTLTEDAIKRLLNVNRGMCGSVTMARIVADAAVKQYILDLEKEAANAV